MHGLKLTKFDLLICLSKLALIGRDCKVTVAVSPLSATSALRVFRHVAQIPIGNLVLRAKTSEFEKKRQGMQKVNLPEPT